MAQPDQSELERLQRAIDELQDRLATAKDELARVRAELGHTSATLLGLVSSRSWKVTTPLRGLSYRVARLKSAGARLRSPSRWSRETESREARASLLLHRAHQLVKTRALSEAKDEVVDVVVPVYGHLTETRKCLLAVLGHKQTTPFELIVIDDASPSTEVRSYLQGLNDRGLITLVTNEHNLGFSASANIGLALHPGRDVVLLNSDTEVANDWLDRLRRCAMSQPRVATVTPFSNAAKIYSYPSVWVETPAPSGPSLQEIDRITRDANAGASVQIPTGVGFAMYIARGVLEQIGFFDDLLFGQGYGEENDFCLRATAQGWMHLLAPDVFIAHVGGASFEGKDLREARALHKLLSLYPEYQSVIDEFAKADPVKPLRLNIDVARLNASSKPIVLIVTNSRGGGVQRHVRDLTRRLADHTEFVRLAPRDENPSVLELVRLPSEEKLNVDIDANDDAGLLQLLRRLDIARIHYQHLLDLPSYLSELGSRLGVPYDFTVHDYFAICPRVTLTHVDTRYCGEPDEAGCNVCLKQQPKAGDVSIEGWRAGMRRFLEGCERVFVPSRVAAQSIRRHFPAARLNVVPHRELEAGERVSPVTVRRPDSDESTRVLVIGALSPVKGADTLEAAAVDAMRRKHPIEFHLLGYAYRPLKPFPDSNLHIHGSYNEEEVMSAIRRIDPHLCWFPAVWPETYCYALSPVLDAGLPVAATNLGAIPERVTGRDHSWILDWRTSPAAWNDFFMQFRNGSVPPTERARELHESEKSEVFRYATDYATGAFSSSTL